jgi:hypothetical protein
MSMKTRALTPMIAAVVLLDMRLSRRDPFCILTNIFVYINPSVVLFATEF